MTSPANDRAALDGFSVRAAFAAAGLVAGIYVFFLIFAQFGFLQGLRAAGYALDFIHRALGSMALAGIGAGMWTAWATRRLDARWIGAAGLLAAAVAGALAGIALADTTPAPPVLVAVALLTGAGLGAATVAAAILLREFTGGRALGLHVGAGTGLAYFLCNVPAILDASPSAKGWISAAAALVGAAAALSGRTAGTVYQNPSYTSISGAPGVAMAALGFLALVWFDSAAFAAMQNAPELRSAFWHGPQALWIIGTAHALAAIAAGLLIDRGALRTLLACALLLLVAGHLGFGMRAGVWPAPVYASGVSLYSTALAAFAALGPADRGLRPAVRAAWVYSLSGWVGSAAGVGMAEQLGHVPAWAAPAAAIVLATALLRLSPAHS